MKCLPASKLPEANGNGLHDWHAEILAIRTFNRFLLDECMSLSEGGAGTGLLQRNDIYEESTHGMQHATPFRLRDGVKLHMYCSEAPCTHYTLFAPHSQLTRLTSSRRRCKHGAHHGRSGRRLSLAGANTVVRRRDGPHFPDEHSFPSSASSVANRLAAMPQPLSPSLVLTSLPSSNVPRCSPLSPRFSSIPPALTSTCLSCPRHSIRLPRASVPFQAADA